MKPDNAKKYENLGPGIGISWGIRADVNLEDNLAITLGLGLANDIGKIGFTQDSTFYILNKDEEFTPIDTASWLTINPPADNSAYLLLERTYRINYIHIPIGLKMRTKEVGYFVYYGQFGANIGIKTKARVKDQILTNNNAAEISDLILNDGIQPIKLSLNVGIGAEYNLSGSTSMFFGASYNHGFSNSLRKSDRYLRRLDDNNGLEELNQVAFPRNFALNLGVLF